MKVPDGLPDPGTALAQVFLLGPIGIFRGGQRLAGGWRRKSLELLAYLAVHREGVAKDQILEALWPETDPIDSQRYFWQSASYLRCRLRGETVDQRIVWQVDDLYRLNPQSVWVDVEAFDCVIARSGSSNDPKRFLRFACDIYKGEFCEGRYFGWATLVRERLRSQFIEASRTLAKLLERERKPEAALSVLDRALLSDPYDEGLVRRAMKIEADRGRRDLLVRRFRRLKRLLLDDLNVQVSGQTDELLRRIAESDSGFTFQQVEMPK